MRCVALAFVVGALAITACGSSAHKPITSSHGLSYAFSKCMRSHGVPNFPDPKQGSLNLNGTGINPSSPSFEAAQTKCNKQTSGGGIVLSSVSEHQKEQLFATSRCMRSHGVPGFPDPTTTPPTNPQDYSIDEGISSNLFVLVPNTINPSSPAFERAAKACDGP